jgi:hypothetical protein
VNTIPVHGGTLLPSAENVEISNDFPHSSDSGEHCLLKSITLGFLIDVYQHFRGLCCLHQSRREGHVWKKGSALSESRRMAKEWEAHKRALFKSADGSD